jgi:hypothetical protein
MLRPTIPPLVPDSVGFVLMFVVSLSGVCELVEDDEDRDEEEEADAGVPEAAK